MAVALKRHERANAFNLVNNMVAQNVHVCTMMQVTCTYSLCKTDGIGLSCLMRCVLIALGFHNGMFQLMAALNHCYLDYM